MPASSITAGCHGDFLLLGEIARGASGVVWHAVRLSLNRPCALKFLLDGQHASATDRARLKAEAEAAAALDHPALVRMHGAGELDGHPYLEMELLPGETLADRMAAQPPSWRQCAEWLHTLADGLAHAHAIGVLHRDIKPSNILLTPEGAPKLGDFGLARMLARPADLTATFGVVGTPIYLAPEIAREGGRAASTASDIFSLGAVFHELLVGQPPRPGSDPIAILSHAQQHPLPAPGRLRPGIPPDLDVLCQRCVAEDPSRRIPSARDLAAELARHLEGKPIQSRPPAPLERLVLWMSRHRTLAAAITLAALAILVGSGAGAWNWQRARERAAQLRAQAIVRSIARNQEIATGGLAPEALLQMADMLRRFPDHEPSRQHLAHWLSLPGFCPMPTRSWAHESGARKAGYSGDEHSIWVALDDGRVVVRPVPTPDTHSPSNAPVAFVVPNVGTGALASLNHDGSRLLAWQADRRLVQWAAPRLPATAPVPEWELPNILHAALSSDQSHWVAVSRDGQLWSASILSNAPPVRWNMPSAFPTNGLLAIANSGNVVAFSPDALHVHVLRDPMASTAPDALVIDVPVGAQPLRMISLSVRGGILLGITGRSIRVWSTEAAKPAYKPLGSVHPDSLVALNASGKQVIIAIPKVGIRGQPIQPVETGFGPEWSRGWDFTDMALGSSSQVAVVTAEGRLLQKRSREGNFVSGPFHRSPARSVAFSPSSSRLLVAHADGHVVEYPALSGVAPFRAGSLGPGPWVASRNPSHGPAVLSSSPSSPPLSEWDPSDPALAASPANLGAAPRCFAYAPAQRRFLGVFEDPSVVASFLPDDPSRAMAWNAPKPVQHLWAHPAGPHALVAGTDSLHALLWTGDRWIEVGSFPIRVTNAVFHPTRPEAILLARDGQPSRWVASGRTSSVVAVPSPFPVAAARVTPDGSRILWVSRGNQSRLSKWSAPIEEGLRFDARSHIRAHSLSDTRLALASDSGISVWFLKDPLNPVELVGPFRPIQAIALSPDDRRIAIHADNNWVRFHDTLTGERIGRVYNLLSNSRAQGPWNIEWLPSGTHLWGWTPHGGIFSIAQPLPIPSSPDWPPILIDLAEHMAQDPIPTPADLPARTARLQRLQRAMTEGLWRPEWDGHVGVGR